jgi:hypothetical protein
MELFDQQAISRLDARRVGVGSQAQGCIVIGQNTVSPLRGAVTRLGATGTPWSTATRDSVRRNTTGLTKV